MPQPTWVLLLTMSIPLWLQCPGLVFLTWQWVHFTQMASRVTRSQSNRHLWDVVEWEIRVRKPVSIWWDHHLPHAVQHISFAYIWSGCWFWPMECWSTPLQWLCEVAGYWQELEHAVVYADPEHPKHAQWVTCPVSMLAIQELGCF